VVNPQYFVGFSSSTLLASIILFRGLNTTGGSNTFSLLCGLYVISLGVYLLNLSRADPDLSSNRPRHSTLLDSGIIGQRTSLSHTRLSLDSDGGMSRELGRSHEARRSGNLYRSGGATGAGGTLFEYEEGEGEEHSMDELEGERRGLAKEQYD